MKVLLAHNNFAISGGAERFYHEVGRILEKNGHQVAYFSSYVPGCDSTWSDYFPPAPDYHNASIFQRVVGFPSMVYSRSAKGEMERLIGDFKPDIIHVFAIHVKLTPSILDAAKEAGVPVVMNCNDYKHICPNYKLYHHGHICEECKGGRFYRAMVNHCCHDSLVYSTASMIEAYVHSVIDIYRKNIHTFLFASEFMARKTEEFWGVETFHWRKLRNPFDSTKYKATYCPNGPVLFFGRLIEEKGVDVLVRAAAKLPNVDVRIVGDGPDMDNLRKLANELGVDNVAFPGAMWGDDMDRELKACRFVVVPSKWHENFPYVINQAFAFGKPVVGSRRGGITELVADGERGLLYEATDPDALADAIQQLCDNPDRVKSMGCNAKEFSDREFNDERFYQALQIIYEEVIS